MKVEDWLGKKNQLGIDIWNHKYRYDNETFDEWLDRISGGEPAYAQLIYDHKFIPGGRILANRGLNKKGKNITLSNCYVIPAPEDSIESIFDCAKQMARTFSYGGGVGIDISKLAPNGASVNNAAEKSSGAVSFMDLYSLVTGLIAQSGRRGALMISMDCSHPDIEEFINIKSDLNKVTKANISVKVTDEFMVAVTNHEPYDLKYYRPETNETIDAHYDDAYKLFHKICEMNWNYAEPGILFWDTIKENNLLSTNPDFEYAGVNPCAEEPLPAGGSCLLGSINLAAFVHDGNFDYEDLKDTVDKAVCYLNEIMLEGMDLHPLEIQRKNVNDWRQIGLGVCGLADALIKMEIRYGSQASLEVCDRIAATIASEAIYASNVIAELQGDFPKCNKEIFNSSFFKRHKKYLPETAFTNGHGLAHSQLLTCAPTGSISTMIGVSGGIEPIFANSYTRKTESLHGHDEYYKIYTPIVEEYMKQHELTEESQLPSWFITAPEIQSKERIDMQAVWQQHIDASISSTINLPNTATVEDIEDIYQYAWIKGLKGVTIYRAGCAREGILVKDGDEVDNDTQDINLPSGPVRGEIIQVKDTDTIGFKRKLVTGCGSLHCAAYFDVNTGDLVETYLSKGSTGGCNNFMIGLSRLISMSARAGVSIEDIVDQLMSTGTCPSYASRKALKNDTSKGSCCPMAVGYALKEMWEELNDTKIKCSEKKKEAVVEKIQSKSNEPVCPQCGEPLIFEGGCNVCKNCGWSKCD